MIIYASYLSTEHLISQENNVLLIFWFSPLRVTRIVITGMVLNCASSAWALQILYIPFYAQTTDEGKADNVFWPKSSPSSWRDSALRGKGLRVTLSTSYIPNPFSHTAVLCSVNAARRGHWGSVNMGSVGEQTVGACGNEARSGFRCGFLCLLE